MRFWRLVTAKWALDKTCEGARTYGGRWNPAGVAAFYAATTPELCALEKFVHLSGLLQPPMQLVAVDAPDDLERAFRPALTDLPKDWGRQPPSAGSQQFGARWLEDARDLIMLVPSVIVPESSNVLINPVHPRYSEIKLMVIREFRFDSRMFLQK